MRTKRAIKLLSHLCRTILAITFIFSGVVKVIDPWGTALKVHEYLSIYGWDSLQPYVMPFSIWLCGAELMMGLMLLFKVRIRLISIFAVCSMLAIDTSFTILLTRGMMRKSNVSIAPMTIISETAAASQFGIFLPRIEGFFSRPITGLAISDTTTAIRI